MQFLGRALCSLCASSLVSLLCCSNVGQSLLRATRSRASGFPSAPSWTEQRHSWPNSRSRSSHTSWVRCATLTTPPASYPDDGWNPTQRMMSWRSGRTRKRMKRIRQRKTHPPVQKHHVSSTTCSKFDVNLNKRNNILEVII